MIGLPPALTTGTSLGPKIDPCDREYRALFEGVTDIVILATGHGAIVDANPAAARVFNRSRQQMRQATLGELFPQPGHLRLTMALDRLRREGRSPVFELPLPEAGGGTVTLEAAVHWTVPGTGAAEFQIVARNVTEQRRLELQLRQAQKLELLGRLAGNMAHDLNNLLTVIGGCGDELRTTLPPGDERRACVEELNQGVERAGELIRQMLAFSRRQPPQPRRQRLDENLQPLIRLLYRLLGGSVELVVEQDAPLGMVQVDLQQIEQVLVNLAVNARDAMPAGGRLTLRFANLRVARQRPTIGASMPPGDYVMLAVEDTGSGMSEELKERVFEPFFTTKGECGTGLGLPIVLALARQNQGYLEMESRPGKGTRFRLFLPQAPA